MNQAFGLDAFNFTLAGAREGFGPFLGVYLQHQGFDPARTGFAMSLAGLAGIAAAGPLGALIDRITAKRAAAIFAVVCIAAGAGLIVASKQLWIVAVGQVWIGIADSSLAPLVAALTLGLVGSKRYADRVARNEAFNHAGNAANAAVAALLGYCLGLGFVAAAIGIMALATGAVMLLVDPKRIDHEAARGGNADSKSNWWRSRPILLLAGTVFAFQTANGAMLPFIAQALTAQGDDPSLTTGAMTVTAQVSMIGAALLVPRLSRRVGQRVVLGSALLLVVVRATLAACGPNWWTIAIVVYGPGRRGHPGSRGRNHGRHWACRWRPRRRYDGLWSGCRGEPGIGGLGGPGVGLSGCLPCARRRRCTRAFGLDHRPTCAGGRNPE